MRLLLDECVPEPLGKEFAGHDVSTVEEAGWKGLKNGVLLFTAASDFDVLVTVDKGFEHQQNLQDLPIAVLLLSSRSNKLERLQELIPDALLALRSIAAREFIKIEN
ncbi:MAG: DUF5615 family PIN-like protein [Pyrinomonadaceae bacterium]|nr:DUF5615 family PIN-like protein [Pyrinomonadaceae bacterium]